MVYSGIIERHHIIPLMRMARCSIRRLFILLIVIMVLLFITSFSILSRSLSGHAGVSDKAPLRAPKIISNSQGQKPIFRYKLERELEKLMGQRLTPNNDAERAEEKRGYALNGFNQFRSDRLPLDREVPDTREPKCLSKHYPSQLPSTSVIIIFHNEAYSALLRTVTSVLNRSPPHLLHEIVLVDDKSDHTDLGVKLDNFTKLEPKIKIHRHSKREGLIRARMTGAKAASGEVLLFLDSHCEVNLGWLEPLLERIAINRSNVVCPVIDVISLDKLMYSTIRGPPGVRGGFNWNLQFKWKKIPEYEQKRRGHDETREVYSPTMAGGLFAIDRSYFFEIGAYDMGMDIWGGENLEISFRIWMCGGKLELIPCSRVGHIFRKSQPYSFPGGVDTILIRNNMRLAEVWMDEYKEHYYAKRPSIRSRSYGDISERLELRKKLHCKSFRWYMENVYSEMPLPLENLRYGGYVMNPQSKLCFDTMGNREYGKVSLFTCHGIGGNQEFGFSDSGELIFDDDLCLDISSKERGGKVGILNCHGLGGNQKWEYNNVTRHLQHMVTKLCVEKGPGNILVMNNCMESFPSQEWIFGRKYNSKKRKH